MYGKVFFLYVMCVPLPGEESALVCKCGYKVLGVMQENSIIGYLKDKSPLFKGAARDNNGNCFLFMMDLPLCFEACPSPKNA